MSKSLTVPRVIEMPRSLEQAVCNHILLTAPKDQSSFGAAWSGTKLSVSAGATQRQDQTWHQVLHLGSGTALPASHRGAVHSSLLTAGIASVSPDTAQGGGSLCTESHHSQLIWCCVLGRTKAEVADLVIEHLQILLFYK